MQSGPSDYTTVIPLASHSETLAEGGCSQVQRSHTRAPFQGSARSLSHWCGFFCVSNLSPSAQPCGLPPPETKRGQSSLTWSLLSPEQQWSSACRNPLPTSKSSQAQSQPLGRGSPENRQDLLCSALQEGIVLARDRPQQSSLSYGRVHWQRLSPPAKGSWKPQLSGSGFGLPNWLVN